IEIGLRHIETVCIDSVHERVRCLTAWLIENLLSLRHSNGEALVALYGPADTHMRGGTIALNFYDPDGHLFKLEVVEAQASERRLSLRTGCFCNPGASENALGYTGEDLAEYFHLDERMTIEQFAVAMAGKNKEAVGAVRVSVGIVTNFADVYRFMQFAEGFLDRPANA
ncbi:MAG TPA: hypothetical protein VJZ27_03885, partial [Aggregatilineales bacterium]|nr:hypothetical protein [Aggregatilineales bacterium]